MLLINPYFFLKIGITIITFMCACVCSPTVSYSHPPPNVTPKAVSPTHCYDRFYLTLFMGNCVWKQQMCHCQSHTVG